MVLQRMLLGLPKAGGQRVNTNRGMARLVNAHLELAKKETLHIKQGVSEGTPRGLFGTLRNSSKLRADPALWQTIHTMAAQMINEGVQVRT